MSTFVIPLHRFLGEPDPAPRAEEGDWACCQACEWQGSDACEECEQGDLFEPMDSAVAA